MAFSGLQKFIDDYSKDANGIRAKYAADPDGTLKPYSLTSSETSMVRRGDPHEIKDHMKDAYAASLSIDDIR